MFTDMVGYTALTQSNESQAMQVLERHNQLLRPFFPKFHGKKVKAIGDSFLVEFESALDALKCAVEIQSYLHDYNLSSNDSWKINLRIGIHLGDVIHQAGDVFGDAVNIASRIEPIAGPEGICISEQVYDQVRNKSSVTLVKLAPKDLKNVQFPVDIYEVVMPWQGTHAISPGQTDRRRIAVLPFANMSPDPNDSYFADGITEEIISIASNVSGLSVISRTSVMGYKGTKKVKEIGRELEVGSVLEGSFRKAGNRIRVTTQLINVNNDSHVWAQSYDRELDDVFAVQTDIAKQVADALKVRILPNERQRIERAPTESTAAFTLYLKGRYYWNERTESGLRKGIQYFEKAVEKDPKYALAYVGMADCHNILVNHGYIAPSEGVPKAKEYLAKALSLDEELGEAHAALGHVLQAGWEWARAEQEFRKAIALNPSYASAHHWYALHLAHMGRLKEGIAEIERAHELDPNSLQILTAKGITLYYARDYDKALEIYQRVLQTNPNFLPALANMWFALLRVSKIDEAKALVARMLEIEGGMRPSSLGAYAMGYAALGDREKARDLLAEAEKPSAEYTSPVNIGMAHYYLGDTDLAFEWFYKALEQRDQGLAAMKVDPEYDSLRNDSRFVELIKRLGL
jgi:TolB-like protein/Tfp pilus assembly protein PilF